jgi:16S rRNA (guanine527-N7)-methyltransferase
VDNEEDELRRGAEGLGVNLSSSAAARLALFAAEVRRWSAKVPLVGRHTLPELLEKHILDSLAVAPDLFGVQSVLDIGTGAGFPGIPLKVQLPSLRMSLVEPSGKKAAFLQHVARRLELSGGLSIYNRRASGEPEGEGLPRAEAVISRALAPLPSWLELGAHYLRPGGRVFAMLAQPEDSELREAAHQAGVELLSIRRFALPVSKTPRALATFQVRGSAVPVP